MAVTDRDRKEWANSPAGQEFIAMLNQSRLDTLETWAHEGYTQETADGTLQANAKALGGIAVLDQTLDLMASWQQIGEEVVA